MASKTKDRLDASRREFEGRLTDVRTAISRELGWSPKAVWVAPLVAFGCGVALALAVGRKKRG